jgi:hypothetical protein
MTDTEKLSAELKSLTRELKTREETESQLEQKLIVARRASQRVRDRIAAVRHESKVLAAHLDARRRLGK